MEKLNRNIMFLSTTLCFFSGTLNTVMIVKFLRGVTYLTGSFSKLSVEVVNGNIENIVFLSGIVLYFFFGSIFSGFIIGKKEFSLKKRYGLIIIGIGLLITLSKILIIDEKKFILILSFISGLQNGMFITYKGIVIRTTHATGGITDLGVSIGNYIKNKNGEIWKIQFQIIVLLGFFLGGITGALECIYFTGYELYILSGSYVGLGVIYFLWRQRVNKQIYRIQ